ncbi:LytR/AlgR family response regulator transcription factor [Lysinibacillus sp. 54212]|uniref:LytR/AlgR family response regulator transcription factor n=1 Tax=Lysinibacillus sp. 54212 TaxID=3119829 RepID=UPI002FCB7456
MKQGDIIIDRKVLDQYKVILDDWIPKTAAIAIAIENTYVYFTSGSHELHLEVGSAVKEDSLTHRVLQTQTKTDAVMDNSLFNTPYYAIGYPVLIDGKQAALVVVLPPTYSPQKQEPYRFLTGKQNEDWSPIPIEEISHIESLQKRTWFYRNGEQYKTSVTLKELEIRLPKTFIRIHRSYIINIHFIKKISRDITSNFIVLMKDGTELPVSQSYMNNLRTILEF